MCSANFKILGNANICFKYFELLEYVKYLIFDTTATVIKRDSGIINLMYGRR